MVFSATFNNISFIVLNALETRYHTTGSKYVRQSTAVLTEILVTIQCQFIYMFVCLFGGQFYW